MRFCHTVLTTFCLTPYSKLAIRFRLLIKGNPFDTAIAETRDRKTRPIFGLDNAREIVVIFKKK